MRYDPADSLPLNFGSESATPNCLGTAMLLCGFAMQTGAKYFLCSYLEHRATEPNLSSILDAHKAIKLMDEYGIHTSQKGVSEAEAELPIALEKWSNERLEDFHYALIIQLADGIWMMVDPYQKTAARLPAAFGMDEASSVLDIYSDLYPGMTIICDDGGKLHQTLKTVDALHEEAHIRAVNLMAPFNTLPLQPAIVVDFKDSEVWEHSLSRQVYYPDYFDFSDLLHDTDDALWFETLMRLVPQCKDIGYDRHLVREVVDDVIRKYVEIAETVSPQAWEEQNSDFYDAILEEVGKKYAIKSFADILAEAHTHLMGIASWVTDPILEGIWSGLEYPHPVIEVMNPAFGLALALLNQLRCWTVNDVSGNVLLCYGASQQYWHEAASTESALTEDLRQIEDLVRMLPHHYPLVQNKLDYFERMRQVNHGNVRQEEGNQRRNAGNGSERVGSHCLEPQAG